MKNRVDIHEQAKHMKNRRRLKHDGGRAWIKDSQLHDAIPGRNAYITRPEKEQPKLVDDSSVGSTKEAWTIHMAHIAADNGHLFCFPWRELYIIKLIIRSDKA